MQSRILTCAAVIFLLAATSRAGEWSSYTNTDAVRQIFVSGSHVWGATSGGVEALDFNTGDIIKLTNTDGLKGINIKCAEGDTAGSLWFGTSDGWLTKIPSTLDITNYAFRDSVGLSGRAIGLFALKSDGDRLWVASDIGVSKFSPYVNGGEIKDTARRLGNIPTEEDAVCVNVIGPNLWVGTARGVAFIDKNSENIQYFGNWRSFVAGDNGLLNADIRSIVSHFDTVMVGTAGGVFKLQVSPDTLWIPVGTSTDIIFKLYMAGSTLLAATSQGILQFNGTDWIAYINTGLPSGLANDLMLDSRNILWAATPASGLAELSGSQWVLHSIPGPASNIIGRIAIDSAGGVWMTHDSKGLSRYAGGQWNTYNTSNSDPDGAGPLLGLADNNQVSLSIAPNGAVWAGSFGGGLYQYDWTSWHHWTSDNSPMYGVQGNHLYWAATAVLADSTGNIWVSSLNGDNRLLMGVFAPYSPDSTWQLFFAGDIGLITNYINALGSRGNIIWVARGDGIDRLDNGGTPFNTADDHWLTGVGDENTTDLCIDPAGSAWFATATGLFYSDLSIDSVINVPLPPQISGSVNGVSSDGVGNIWVGTVAGLGMLKPNRVEPQHSLWQAFYTTSNSPILGDNINSVTVDVPNGLVYIGTNNGLSAFNSGILPPKSDLADMTAYPNPVILGQGDQFVSFKRVPSSGTLAIYSASGDLVRKIDLAQSSTWDLRNSNGERVAGGIYFFYVRSGDASGTGKIAVIK